MTSSIKKTLALVLAIRACSDCLSSVTHLVQDNGHITRAMRFIMEFLRGSGAITVAAMARRLGMSRQHVLSIANMLIVAGLADRRPNAADRRSPLIRLSPLGQRSVDRLLRNEAEFLLEIEHLLEPANVDVTLKTLGTLRVHLQAMVDRHAEPGTRNLPPTVLRRIRKRIQTRA